jgi:hypothetical protein
MFFLIRVAFWLCVVLALLPTFAGHESTPQTAAQQSSIGAGEAVVAASATVSDLTGFCSRQPEACSVGSQAAVAFGHKAQAGAKILYEYLNDRATPKATGSVQQPSAAAVPMPPVRKPMQAANGNLPRNTASSRETLTPTDLGPAWRNPSARADKTQAKHAG